MPATRLQPGLSVYRWVPPHGQYVGAGFCHWRLLYPRLIGQAIFRQVALPKDGNAGMMLLESARKLAFTGLGLLVLTRERAERLVQELIQQGAVSREEGKELVDSLMQRVEAEMDELRRRVRSDATKALEGAGIATKDDLQALVAKIDELEIRLRRLEPDQ